jgi:hypothetical protein
MLVPPPRLVTNEERQRQCRFTIFTADEHALAAWRENFPQDIVDQNEFFKQQWPERKAARQAKRARKAFILAQMEGPTTIGDKDPLWADLFSSTASSSCDSDIESSTTKYFSVYRIFLFSCLVCRMCILIYVSMKFAPTSAARCIFSRMVKRCYSRENIVNQKI